MDRGDIKSAVLNEMRRRGIRITAQRLAVAGVLLNARDHPTAQEVFDRVQAEFPHITVATVYNTIHTLTDSGLIQPLPFSNGTRYEANLTPHANLVCQDCGAIIDAMDEDDLVRRLGDQIAEAKGFRVITQRVDFYGLCADCRGRATG